MGVWGGGGGGGSILAVLSLSIRTDRPEQTRCHRTWCLIRLYTFFATHPRILYIDSKTEIELVGF